MRRISTLLISLSLASCAQLNTSSEAQYLTVLHTNDNHGRFWQNEHGEYGMAARKTLIDNLRAEAKSKGQEVILLSGGDINTGIPESDLQFAEPDFKGMKMLGYDAMAIGNHEFDNTQDILKRQIEWAEFPVLSANIIDEKTAKPAYQPYTIINKGHLKIAVIGLTTVDTAKIANPDYIAGLRFEEPATITEKLASSIKAQYQPDVTIAVTHMGHYHNANFGINAPGDVTLARTLPKGTLDLIVGGHSQEPVCVDEKGDEDTSFAPGKACKPDNQNGTWIMQAHEWGKYVGKAEFKIQDGKVELLSYALIPVNLKDKTGNFVNPEIKPDPEMLSFLTPYQEKGAKQLEGAVGHAIDFFDGERSTVRFKQSPLADLIIAAQMAATHADFGIISGGGIRASIEAGEVSYKDILKVHPFKNRITYVEWTGKELADYLNIIARYPPDSGAYLQYHNITFTVGQDTIENIQVNGAQIKPDGKYRMSINSYNASGGDGYPSLTNNPTYVDTSRTDAEVLKEYFQHHSPVATSAFRF
ncbi:bifunctional UDP-sugar hydrolase/5'-nucleotidase UshA (plasmid) [Pseudoalteromonas xiamenensis]|uniref:bifunctional UDP-sugar hydrolase/5'-nucleotidase UshA n=1 Tax=Pseudoalteromonas xiamenensis TaxID=882626 RepID=UPI0027E4655B|nr:bifunctional UDP-sugar hydrolase/5'-nucleotidase UshA [Pseudoalteromonas xiamenensis]WMN62198.1 bifunctional UDP-sugar hydrolase/5'-nucleotidase UshA [Pseudoalteromonas xiamenensis]